MPQTHGARTGFLSPYRVLDLTDHRGALAGRIFAQLGADVVQVEGPDGVDARRIGPFGPDGASMTWAAHGAGKRSLMLDPGRSAHRELLRDLVARADFVLESRAPGEPAWLGAEVIEAANPAAIHVRLTPFGLTGPKAAQPATDLTLWAAGGPLAPTAVDGHPPVRMSVPQAWAHAAADAVGGALVAHFARLASGRGQGVEVSALRSATQCTLSASLAPAIGHKGFALRPSFAAPGSARRGPLKSKWRGRDGLLEMPFAMGPATGGFTNAFFAWMRERGALSERFFDWDFRVLHIRLMAGEIPDEAIEALQAETAAFLAHVGRDEAVETAIARKLLLAPIATIRDLAESPHLSARGFWEEVPDGRGGALRLPGPLAATEAPAFALPRPAPGLGEHSEEVLNDWLGGPDPERPSALPAPAAGEAPGALAGIRVLDLAWVVAGPMIGRNLADHGATVLRVESSRRIEAGRNTGPYKDGVYDPALSALFQNCNAGKAGLCLDLSREEGREVVRDLVAWADLVVESFAPGRMDAWGLGYEALREINPRIILLSSSLMGQTGPWAKLAGFGNVGAAMSGAQALAGVRGEMPVGPSGPYTDFVGPRYGVPLALAALDWRRRTGRGCRLDLSQGEAGIQFLAPAIADHSASGRVAEADGCRDPGMAPHGVFPCAPGPDGAPRWLALAVRDDADWRALAGAMGRPDWSLDPGLAGLAGRKARETALEAGVADWTSARTVEEAEAALIAAGLPAHRAASYDDLWADPQLAHDGHWIALPHPIAGETWVEACRYRLSATPGAPARCAPTFGRDRDWALGEALGYAPDRIAALEAAGVLE
ncbi:MAG: CoA transferase [Pseudomonadota bacterium]|nr:CoA transferase [Pseudomonadota bacterium]